MGKAHDRSLSQPSALSIVMESAKNGCLERHVIHAKLRCAWQQLAASKVCFQMLKGDLMRGMAETLDIFSSMSIPLIRLVGMKVEELANEGRNVCVSISSPPPKARCPMVFNSNSSSEPGEICCSAVTKARQILHHYKEGIMNIKASTQLMEEFSLLHKKQLRQLVGMVKMVEALVRSQEAAITDMFQDCEKYFDSVQKDYILNFKNLHHQVAQMRQQDSRITYRLRVAEQSYQALMSLAIKLQESLLEGLKKNVLDLKDEVEEMVNELASNMCKPLIVFLKEFQEDGAATVISKLKILVESMESEMSANIETLSAANDEVMAFAKRIDLQSQAQNKELQALSRQGKLLNKSLDESFKTVEELKQALAQKTALEQELKDRLQQENMRVCKLEEELGKKEAALEEAFELLDTLKGQLSYEHCQMAEAVTMSRKLCDQLSALDDRLCLTTKGALDQGRKSIKTEIKDSIVSSQQALCVTQFQLEHSRSTSCSVGNGQADNMSLEQGKELKQVMSMSANCDMLLESQVQDNKEPLHGRNLEQVMKSILGWISETEEIQALIESAAIEPHDDQFVTQLTCICARVCQTEASEFLQYEKAPSCTEFSSVRARFWLPLFLYLIQPNHQALSTLNLDYRSSARTVTSDVQNDLKDFGSEQQVRILGLNKSAGSLVKLLITIGMAIVSKNLRSGSPADVHHKFIDALTEQTSRGRLVQDAEATRKFLESYSNGTLGSRKEHTSCHTFTGKNSEEEDNGGKGRSSLASNGRSSGDVDEPEDAVEMAANERQQFSKSALSHGSPRGYQEATKRCGDEATTLGVSQNDQVSKELWRVLELAPENGNTQYKRSNKKTGEACTAGARVKRNQLHSEPLLALSDDVAHPKRLLPKTRTSPRSFHRAAICPAQTVKRHCMQLDRGSRTKVARPYASAHTHCYNSTDQAREQQ